MKRPIKVFEPIPKSLIKSLHFQGKQNGFGEEDVYRLVTELIGIPSITALSKQEAIFLIAKMTGQTARAGPQPPPYENEILGGDALASFYHVRDLRLMFSALGWGKDRIRGWLKKFMKVGDFRELDRTLARKAFYALGQIHGRKQNPDGQQDG